MVDMKKLAIDELDRLSVEEFKKAKKLPVVVVLDNVRSLNNIGSVFRTADAFLIEKIMLCGITAKPPHRDIHKTALGATESVKWEYFDTTAEALQKLKENNFTLLSIEQVKGSIHLNGMNIEKEGKYGLIFGNEVKGVAQEVIDQSDFCLEIPQHGTKHSLNISVCAGIVLWEFFSKMQT